MTDAPLLSSTVRQRGVSPLQEGERQRLRPIHNGDNE